MQTLVIGSSANADIVLADTTVARQHAELVITDDGRYHLTDCGSDGGTWRAVARRQGEEVWERTRQSFVAAGQPLRFGHYRTSVEALLAPRAAVVQAAAGGEAGSAVSNAATESTLRGPVARDPRTGEIVRRRI